MKILVPVDDKRFGQAIVRFLTQHDWSDDTVFRIVHVIEPILLDHSGDVTFTDFLESTREETILSATELVRMVAGWIKSARPEAKIVEEWIEGHTKDEILKIARDWQADLIVAGSHGRKGFSRFVLGSISLALVSAAPCAVVLVKPDENSLELWNQEGESTPADSIDLDLQETDAFKVVVAIDKAKQAEPVLDFVMKHKWGRSTQMKVIHVVEPLLVGSPMSFLPPPVVMEHRERMLKEGKALVGNSAQRLRDELPSMNVEEAVLDGWPKDEIIDETKQWGANLVVVGSHGRHGLEKLFVGSVSLAVLTNAPCSVLVVRPMSSSSRAVERAQKSQATSAP